VVLAVCVCGVGYGGWGGCGVADQDGVGVVSGAMTIPVFCYMHGFVVQHPPLCCRLERRGVLRVLEYVLNYCNYSCRWILT
jgi:hypothetical protein